LRTDSLVHVEIQQQLAKEVGQLSAFAGVEGGQQPVLVGPVRTGDLLGERATAAGQRDDPATGVVGTHPPIDQSGPLEPVDPLGDRARGDQQGPGELAGAELERRPGPAQRGEYVEVLVRQPALGERWTEQRVEQCAQPMDPTDHLHRRRVGIRQFTVPLLDEPVDRVAATLHLDCPLGVPARFLIGHALILTSAEDTLSSMETIRVRDVLVTAIAPVAWGSTYVVTERLLPPDRPLFAAAVRALPVGLVLLAVCRALPRGDWWWKAAVLGLCNIGAFFPLLFLAAYHLPGGLASTLQATSPLAVMALAWPVIGERPAAVRVVAALVGLLGVGLLVLRSPGDLDTLGLVGAFGSVVVSALGFVLVKRWPAPTDLLTLVSWQLVVGGCALVPVALLVEGTPPAVDLPALAGFVWIGVVGTGLAYVCWFRGLTRMSAGATALIGLVNPAVGTLLGVLVAAEAFGWAQAVGLALVLGGVVAGQRLGGARESGRGAWSLSGGARLRRLDEFAAARLRRLDEFAAARLRRLGEGGGWSGDAGAVAGEELVDQGVRRGGSAQRRAVLGDRGVHPVGHAAEIVGGADLGLQAEPRAPQLLVRRQQLGAALEDGTGGRGVVATDGGLGQRQRGERDRQGDVALDGQALQPGVALRRDVGEGQAPDQAECRA
jgi:probable blue pigment (indigoidine) exporter